MRELLLEVLAQVEQARAALKRAEAKRGDLGMAGEMLARWKMQTADDISYPMGGVPKNAWDQASPVNLTGQTTLFAHQSQREFAEAGVHMTNWPWDKVLATVAGQTRTWSCYEIEAFWEGWEPCKVDDAARFAAYAEANCDRIDEVVRDLLQERIQAGKATVESDMVLYCDRESVIAERWNWQVDAGDGFYGALRERAKEAYGTSMSAALYVLDCHTQGQYAFSTAPHG